ncbi:MAG: hypothetical protein ACI3ZF_03060 [Candidatus Cryptobacteroides sp.]
MFEAAQKYYYQSTSIPRPPLNGFWKACLRIYVLPNESAEYLGYYTEDSRGFLADRPEIYIYGMRSTTDRTSDQLYGTTIHELTHAMHCDLNKTLFDSVELSVKESLARGVQIYLTTLRYPSYTLGSGSFSVNRYTGFMRDLVDPTKNVSCLYYETFESYHYSPSKKYFDNVDSAFSYPELVEAVKTCKTPEDWKERIETLYSGRIPASDLDLVYNYWFVE